MKRVVALMLILSVLSLGCCGATSRTSVNELTGNCANVNLQSVVITSVAADGSAVVQGIEGISLPGFNQDEKLTSENYVCHVGSKAGENANHVYCSPSGYGEIIFTKKAVLANGQIEETTVKVADLEFAKQGGSYILYKITCVESNSA